jgi:hypothetical protein
VVMTNVLAYNKRTKSFIVQAPQQVNQEINQNKHFN